MQSKKIETTYFLENSWANSTTVFLQIQTNFEGVFIEYVYIDNMSRITCLLRNYKYMYI
jgi:hypothetical protein